MTVDALYNRLPDYIYNGSYDITKTITTSITGLVYPDNIQSRDECDKIICHNIHHNISYINSFKRRDVRLHSSSNKTIDNAYQSCVLIKL